MWVADRTDGKIYAYRLRGGRDPAKDFNTLRAVGNTIHGDIWSDGTTMWVVDSKEKKIYSYNMPSRRGCHAERANGYSNGPHNVGFSVTDVTAYHVGVANDVTSGLGHAEEPSTRQAPPSTSTGTPSSAVPRIRHLVVGGPKRCHLPF